MSSVEKAVEFIAHLFHVEPITLNGQPIVPYEFYYYRGRFSQDIPNKMFREAVIKWDEKKKKTIIEIKEFEKTLKRYAIPDLIPVYIYRNSKGGLTFTEKIETYQCKKFEWTFQFEPKVTYCIPADAFKLFWHLALRPTGFDYSYTYSNFEPPPDRETLIYSVEVKKRIMEILYIKESRESLREIIENALEGRCQEENRIHINVKYRVSGLWFYASPQAFYFRFEDIEPL